MDQVISRAVNLHRVDRPGRGGGGWDEETYEMDGGGTDLCVVEKDKIWKACKVWQGKSIVKVVWLGDDGYMWWRWGDI